jgi:hypothetical protein
MWQRLSGVLNAAANISLIVGMVLLSITLFPKAKAWVRGDAPPPSRPEVEYKSGDRAPVFESLSYAHASSTLVLFVRSGCRFCTESMPAYKELADSTSHKEGRFRLAVASAESPAVTETYLKAHNVTADTIVAFGLRKDVGVPLTPVAMLVDSRGLIVDIWIGKQTARQISDLKKRLSITPM